MIVKDEGHVILETLANLTEYFKFDYYAISDTGSSDDTKDKIRTFFTKAGVPGEIHDDPWKDFGHNRTRAFEHAFKKTDYVLVWDADDSIVGDFTLPELTHDYYTFTFGPGTVYSRGQLFNNHKRWKYVGVLHEYVTCIDTVGPSSAVTGKYHFVSGKTGNRSKNPNKYLDDAKTLEKAFHEAYAANDGLFNRYAFYTAQSYRSCGHHESAIDWYKKVLTLNGWIQEKYISCLYIYEEYEAMKRETEGIFYLLESYKFDSRRIEGIYRLIKYYCIKGQPEISFAFYTLIQNYFEKEYLTDTISSRLFANVSEYDFFLPYYMIIVADRVKRSDIAINMFSIIFQKAYLHAGEWWIHNLFHNIQFSIPTDNAIFVDQMLSYVYKLRKNGVLIKNEQYAILDTIIMANKAALGAPCIRNIQQNKTNKTNKPTKTNKPKPHIMLTITTCKRLNLFIQTMNSILRMWKDLDQVDYFFCVDDNSSEEDRATMRTLYPFFNYYMKKPSEKGHRESMNIVWNKLNELKPTYWVHLEDDWLYMTSESYICRGIALLEKYEDQNIHQLVFNREYGLMMKDMDNGSGKLLENGARVHTQDAVVGKNCSYWPHYSMQPSIVRTRIILDLGNYDSANAFFERDYANKYCAAGYKTMFFDEIYSTHIGKQHWEKEGKNAYALNETGQFAVMAEVKAEPEPEPKAEPEVEPKAEAEAEPKAEPEPKPENPEPSNGMLIGTMREHLDQILYKIQNTIPFGLIRPSDGEHHILRNKTLTNCDKWTFTADGILQSQLLNAIQTVDPNLYIGIPCNTCNALWNCTQAIYDDYIVQWKVPLAQRTYANLFMGANWKPFTNFLLSYKRGLYVITSGTRGSALPIQGRCIIDDKLVNTWNTDHEKETERILQFIQDKKGELFCFSAGPLSKYWIPLCMKKNPTNMYVDVGATLDIFTKGTTNRQYTEPNSTFANDVCRFEPLNPFQGSISANKNLVYMCVFHNATYVDLLSMLMSTVKLFSRSVCSDSLDFLVFTSAEFIQKIQRISECIGIPIRTHVFAFTTQHEAGCARLYLYEYPQIAQYEKILYIDTDILVQNDLTTLFAQELEDKIYALGEDTIEKEWMGGWFFDFATIDRATPGMNSGILLFKNRPFVRTLFQEIREHVRQMKVENRTLPDCLDQPFLNYHIIRQAKHETTLLAPYAQLFARNPPSFPTRPTEAILCHFAWPLGKADHKKQRMRAYMEHLFKNYSALYPSEFKDPQLRTKFTWGKNGYIQFYSNRLMTKWGGGTYKWLDSHTVEATWNSYSHILRMNPDYTSFFAICKNDGNISIETHLPGISTSTRMIIASYDTTIPFSGGYGDRIVGMISCKVLADRLGREFRIHWEKENIEPYCNYSKYKYYASGDPAIYNLIDNTTFNACVESSPVIFPEPTVKVYLNHDICQYLYKNPHFGNNVYESDMIRAYSTLYTDIFQLTPAMQKAADLRGPIIGIQIRAGDTYIKTLRSKHTVLENVDETIRTFLKNIKAHIEETTSSYKVFLTSDYDAIYALGSEIWDSTSILYTHATVQHLDRSPTGDLSKIFLDNYILSQKTERMYISEWSNYGRVAALSSPHNNIYDLSCMPLKKEQLLCKHSPPRPMRTNLVYACVFHNEAYVELLKILFATLRLFAQTDTFDILVFTSADFVEKVQRIASSLGIHIHIHTFAFTSFQEAGNARLHIFDYPHITQYEKILYIDTDIIVQNDLSVLFQIEIENKVYALSEGTIEHEYHGGWFFDFTTIDKDTPGMNSGILLFRNTVEIRQIFRNILEHIQNTPNAPSCLDQPFINYHIIKDAMQDTTLLSKYALIYCMDPPPPPSEPTDIILCHFVWPLGNAQHKRNRMILHMLHVFTHYAQIYNKVSYEPFVQKTYLWNKNGTITFDEHGTLTTSWGSGTYTWLDSHTVTASWGSYSHILRMTPDYSSFVSVRSDFDIVSGAIHAKNLVYFSVFYNKKYFKLAKLLLTSLRMFSPITFDILLLTSPDFQKEADELNAIIPIRVHYMPYATIFQAACARLHVFEYPNINQYQKILYLDTDILIKQDMTPIFSEPLADVLYGIEAGTIESVNFGSQFFDFASADRNTPGINSGTLLFNNCATIRDLFARITTHIHQYTDAPPYALDQPFINFHAIRDKLYNNTFLNTHVSLYEGGDVYNYATSSICHFSFPIGNSDHKYARMEAFFKAELTKTEVTDSWIPGSYSWGHGKISFLADRLLTTWGTGTYKHIRKNVIRVGWSYWDHIVYFNEDRTRATSVRISPLDFDVVTLRK